MKFKYKIVIFVAAVLISLWGFNLIASPSMCLLEVGKKAGYEIIENYLSKADSASNEFCHLKG